jgi:excisionase family DNA binding protein
MPDQPPKQTLTIPEVARLLGVGRNTLYDAVNRGEIPVLRIGRRILMSRPAFDRLMEGTK